jgi:hypothetical protein
MSTRRDAIQPVPNDEEEELSTEEVVDLDLDNVEPREREAAEKRKPTTVRVDGKIIHVMHAADWPQTAMTAAVNGVWGEWAEEVIEDDDELDAWNDANLTNAQMEAVFAECGRQARMSMGKSRRRSSSSRGSRRR